MKVNNPNINDEDIFNLIKTKREGLEFLEVLCNFGYATSPFVNIELFIRTLSKDKKIELYYKFKNIN